MIGDLTSCPRWVMMWAIAFAIYSACKLLTLRGVAARSANAGRTVVYLVFWPGMCARNFLNRRVVVRRAEMARWIEAVFKVFLGVFLLWVVIRRVPVTSDLLRGWVGMCGMILVLHFGIFDLLALAFQAMNIDAQPLMDKPLLARSVAEFWSKRWNVAFNQLAFRFVFRRFAGRLGVNAATMLTFGCSGLIHDVVISVPAGGGYGLPTAYFLLQGAAVIAERRLGRRRDVKAAASCGTAYASRHADCLGGRIFTMVVTAGPAFWLFHPAFVRNVMLPFLHAIGCT